MTDTDNAHMNVDATGPTHTVRPEDVAALPIPEPTTDFETDIAIHPTQPNNQLDDRVAKSPSPLTTHPKTDTDSLGGNQDSADASSASNDNRCETAHHSADVGSDVRAEPEPSNRVQTWKITLIATLVTTIVVTALTLSFAERREQAAIQSSQELAWRLALTSGASFPGASLRNLRLPALFAYDVDLSGSDLWEANLAGSQLTRARFDGADLRGAVLRNSTLDGASLNSANLEGTDLQGASLQAVDFRHASMSGADLANTRIDWADMRGVDLTEVNLTGVDLRGVCYDDTTKWPAASTPSQPRCKVLPSTESTSPATNYRIETLATAQPSGEEVKRDWIDEIEIAAGQPFSVLVEFRNTGWTTLSDVVVRLELDDAIAQYVTVEATLLYNENYPEAYEFETPRSAVENGINIGGYSKTSNAFVEVQLLFIPPDSLSCGRHRFTVLGFAQAALLGRVNDGVAVVYDNSACD